MKVVTNIDTCRKSYEVIDSPFKDIRNRYNELPGDIKECFDTDKIINKSFDLVLLLLYNGIIRICYLKRRDKNGNIIF